MPAEENIMLVVIKGKHIHNCYYSSFPNAAINIIWGHVGGEGAFTAARRYLFHISTKYREAEEVLFHPPTSPV